MFWGRVCRLTNECGCDHYFDIDAETVVAKLAEWRRGGMSFTTTNHYLRAIKSFCTWMERSKRSIGRPLEAIRVEADRAEADRDEHGRIRRHFSVEEMQWLVSITRTEPFRWNLAGPVRALIYQLTVGTGLRQNEVRKLRRTEFDLDGDPPTVTVEAGQQRKRRRMDHLPLDQELLNLLRPHLALLAPAAKAFKMPNGGNVSRMLYEDMAAARTAWIKATKSPKEHAGRKASGFLAQRDDAGRVLDFHAFRNTRGVWLLEIYKMHPREIMILIRLSSLALVERYSRSFRISDHSWLQRGPRLSPPDDQSQQQQS